MNINEYVDQLSWKKIAIVIVSFLLPTILLHQVVLYKSFENVYNEVDSSISKEAKRLDNVKERMDTSSLQTKKEIEQLFDETNNLFTQSTNALPNNNTSYQHE